MYTDRTRRKDHVLLYASTQPGGAKRRVRSVCAGRFIFHGLIYLQSVDIAFINTTPLYKHNKHSYKQT